MAPAEADANPPITKGFAMPTVDHVERETPPRSTWMTCIADGRDHLINDEATAVGLSAGYGEYAAACGHVVLAAPMVNPPGPSCIGCKTTLRGNASTGRRRGLIARLLRHRPRTAGSPVTTGTHRAVRR